MESKVSDRCFFPGSFWIHGHSDSENLRKDLVNLETALDAWEAQELKEQQQVLC